MAARKSKPPAEAAVPTDPTVADAADKTPVHSPEEQAPPAENASYIAALQREREGYARYGRKDRMADVDAELKSLGVRGQ